MIAIVDYGMGNLGSIANMLRKLGEPAHITSDPQQIRSASKLILPGVGAFDAGMANLERLGLAGPLAECAARGGTPILGICLGMQLMTRGSEEGSRPGLGWIDAETLRFAAGVPGLKVPHMGWSAVRAMRRSELLQGFEGEPRFYFVHSYHVRCHDRADVILQADHGAAFDAAFQRGPLLGVQFHPEKSHRFGMQLLANFARWVPC